MDRKDKIIKLRAQRYSYGQIGKMFNITRQRVQQITVGTGKTKSVKKLYEEMKSNCVYQCQWGEKCKDRNIGYNDLVIHHIDFNHKNNNPKNLIVLCRYCHLYFHSFNHIDGKIEKKLLFFTNSRKAVNKMTNKFTITRRDILESFNVGDLDNPVTLMNIQEALINCDREN